MSIHKNFGKGRHVLKPNDKVYTPRKIAKQVIDLYNISNGDMVLDAFAGDGAFYDQYPIQCSKFWTEIDRGKDFFEFNKKVDWIITNPPYSIYDEVMTKSMKIAKNIVYLVPLSKVVSSLKRMRQIAEFGGVVSIHYIGSSRCGFPFGFPSVAIHIKKDFKGKTKIKELGDING